MKRVSAGAVEQLFTQRRVWSIVGDPGGKGSQLLRIEWWDGHGAQAAQARQLGNRARQRGLRSEIEVSECADHQERTVRLVTADITQQVEARGICPLEVVQ